MRVRTREIYACRGDVHFDAVRRPWVQVGEPRIAFMPSCLLELEVGDLRHGTAPHEVMDAALR